MPVPVHNLIGFERVHLKPGQSKKVKFTVKPETMMLFDNDGRQDLFLLSHTQLHPSGVAQSSSTHFESLLSNGIKFGAIALLGPPVVAVLMFEILLNATAMFTQPLPERWVRFEGLNTADSNREVVIDLYRVAINPAKDLSVIGNDLMKFELSGQVLADLTKRTALPPPETRSFAGHEMIQGQPVKQAKAA